ncbi:hypothetical protein [Streptomyces sp. AM 2-1-1]|uniref:hypothetical protein n=1 Tax=unclassified Streptomyces TaxID=2593676 RepID=UPI0023B9C17E|nr:hypothetical protein [Streptomyces sp. AM 2-1-1]WEH39200.1 hypothetical protein PZB77_06510 [Streptomyces sp. AM 2-1-1]
MAGYNDGYTASGASINGNSHVLMEIAGLLHEGRPDGEMIVMARAPRTHHEVSEALDSFARFSRNQFLDTVYLLAALSTKLRTAAGDYVHVDHATDAAFRGLLVSITYAPPAGG